MIEPLLSFHLSEGYGSENVGTRAPQTLWIRVLGEQDTLACFEQALLLSLREGFRLVGRVFQVSVETWGDSDPLCRRRP